MFQKKLTAFKLNIELLITSFFESLCLIKCLILNKKFWKYNMTLIIYVTNEIEKPR